jgi:hypothetical protein
VLADLKTRISSSVEFVDKTETESDFHSAPELKVVLAASGDEEADADEEAAPAETPAAPAKAEEKPKVQMMHQVVPAKKEEEKKEAAPADTKVTLVKAADKKEEAPKAAAKAEVDDDSEDDSEDDDDNTASFLQVKSKSTSSDEANSPDWLKGKNADAATTDDATISSQVTLADDVLQNGMGDAAGANNMIKALQSELDTLKAQEKSSLSSLAAMFKKKFNHSKQQQAKLMKTQTKLKDDQKHLESHKKDLESAVSFIENSKARLTGSLNELGNYLRDLAHIALAPPAESEKVLTSMTSDISKSAENNKKAEATKPRLLKKHRHSHHSKKDVLRALGKKQ